MYIKAEDVTHFDICHALEKIQLIQATPLHTMLYSELYIKQLNKICNA